MNTITKIADNLGTTSFKGVNELVSITKQSQTDAVGLLKELTNNVDNQVFKGLANDMINVLGSFYASEEVMCCLIKNLLMVSKAGESIDVWKSKIKQFKENITGEEADLSEEFTLAVSDLSFVKSIDEIIFVIDAIILFMELDVEDIVLPILDFSKLLSDSIVGMIIIAMQEIVFTLRDTAIAWIIDALTKANGNESWIKCLPFMDFVRILRKYIHDYGLLDRLFKLINGHVGGQFKKFNNYKKKELAENVRMIEFLKWLRDILIKMKNATLSWEFCVDLNFDSDDDQTTTSDAEKEYKTFLGNPLYSDITTGDPSNNLNITLGDDNTILSNTGTQEDFQGPTGAKDSTFRPPSNDEVNAFLVNQMGISKDLADQLTGATNNTDNIQGSLSDDPRKTNNDCGYVLSSDDLKNTIKDIIKSNGLV
jgi:hypothetical protein